MQSLSSFLAERRGITLTDYAAKIQTITAAQRSFYSEVCSLIYLVLVKLATNAASVQSFPANEEVEKLPQEYDGSKLPQPHNASEHLQRQSEQLRPQNHW